MQTIPIKKPWKKPERIFVKRFKEGEQYYCKHVKSFPDGSYKVSFVRELSHCDQWQAVVYLGTDCHNLPVYFFAFQWKGFLTKKEAMKARQKYLDKNQVKGLKKLPPQCSASIFSRPLTDKNAA